MAWPVLPSRHPSLAELWSGERKFIIDPLGSGPLQMDALTTEDVWAKRVAEKADEAWCQPDDELEWPIAAWWGCPPSEPVQRVRMAVAAALDLADYEAGQEMESEGAEWRAREKRYREQAENWQDATKRLLGSEWDFEWLWTNVEEPANEEFDEAEADRIREEIRAAREALVAAQAAMQRLSGYGARRLQRGGRADRSLERYVVHRLAWAWRAIMGTEPPRSKSGPFVRFSVAVWRDAGLREDDDLEGIIGAVAERGL